MTSKKLCLSELCKLPISYHDITMHLKGDCWALHICSTKQFQPFHWVHVIYSDLCLSQHGLSKQNVYCSRLAICETIKQYHHQVTLWLWIIKGKIYILTMACQLKYLFVNPLTIFCILIDERECTLIFIDVSERVAIDGWCLSNSTPTLWSGYIYLSTRFKINTF